MRRIILIPTALVIVACARPSTLPYTPRPVSNDLVTWTELTTEAPQDTYSALQRLRPLFLAIRPGWSIVHGEIPRIRVFIDGDYAGDVDVLRSIPVRDIESIRRLQPSMAYATMGANHGGEDVLMVRLRYRRPH